MATSRTPDEMLQDYTVAMGPKLGPAFHRLYNDNAWLHMKWNEFLKLFVKSPAQIRALNTAAGIVNLTGTRHSTGMTSYAGFRFPPDIISHAVWLYDRFGLSFRHVEVVYALFGYRRALVASWVTITALLALGYVSPVWPGVGIFAALTLIHLKRQHPVEQAVQPIDRTTIRWVLAMLAILALTFMPVPLRPAP